MPMPVRHLPVLQNWDCHECGQCCREYVIHVTEDERQKIKDQGWAERPEFAKTPLVVRDGFLSDRWRLNHATDGGCVFLDETGRCRIHNEFGGTEKPLACQLYPYVLIPTGDTWRVGVRYACPSATANKGRPVEAQRAEISSYARQLELREGVRNRSLLPPRMRGWQRLSWDDLEKFSHALATIVGTPGRQIGDRWRHVLALAALCRVADFSAISGAKLDEFLDLITPATTGVPVRLDAPSRIGRVLFRLTAALYCRRDTGAKRGPFQRNRRALLQAAIRFARGRGPLPQLHALIPAVTFEELEQRQSPVSAEADELLTRYYRTKIASGQFFGPIHYHDKFWDGLDALALTLPIVLWLARAFEDRSAAAAVETSLQIVDDNFGYNPLLGTTRQKWATRILSGRGEISRLIDWYARPSTNSDESRP